MTAEELEGYLQMGVETQRIEFKGPCEWNCDSMAKDIMALSNVQDGGYIIIGVEDSTFQRKGINKMMKESYDLDIMRDQMAPYADPHVNFRTHFVLDLEGKEYVVIQVFQFIEVPVICKRNGKDAKASTIYYRNTNKRTESAAVSNYYDLRDIIKLAVAKMMQREKSFGFGVDENSEKKRKQELSDFYKKQLKGL